MDINYLKKLEPIDGKWYVSKELGKGAFGSVFEIVRKDYPDIKAALKVISIPNDQSEVDSYKSDNYDLNDKSVTSYFYGFVEEFEKEFKLMSHLKGNSNIVSYEDHDVIKKDGIIGWDIFIRMELLEPMNKYFANKKVEQTDVIKLGIDICKALEVCQKHKIIHRDIKPSNIFISTNGEFKLGDFGVARTLEKTSSGLSKKGTYTYMAPEIFKGEKYNSNVDIYSLGIVMYRFLNNNMEPFRIDRTFANGEIAVKRRMDGESIPAPANANEQLAKIVLKACSYNPKDRYATPTQMREELEDLLNSKNSTQSEEISSSEEKGEIKKMYNSDEKDDATNKTIGFSGNNTDSDTNDSKADSNEAEKKSNSNKAKKSLLIAGIAVVAIVLIGVGLAIFKGIGGGFSGLGKGYTEIQIMPDVEITSSQAEDIAKTIDERAKILGDDYKIKADGQNIILQIKKDMLGSNTEEITENIDLLISRGDFKITTYSGGGVSKFGKEGFTGVELESDKKKTVEAIFGDCLTENLKTNLDKLQDDDIVNYLHITLNTECAAYFEECIKFANERDTQLMATVDIRTTTGIVSSNDIGEVAYMQNGNTSEFYIIGNNFTSVKSTELLKNILIGDELASFMSYQVNDEPEWEDNSEVFGEYQEAESDIKNDYVIVEYQIDAFSEEKSQEDFDGIVKMLKSRLDILKVPYAIGFKGLESHSIMLKISPENLGVDFIRMLIDNGGVEIYSQYKTLCYSSDIASVKVATNSEGKLCLQVKTTTNKDKLMSDYDKSSNQVMDESLESIDNELNSLSSDIEIPSTNSTAQTSTDNKVIYLIVNDTTVASANLSQMSGDTIDFSQIQFSENGELSNADMPMFDLICGIASEEKNYYSYDYNIEVAYYKNNEKDDKSEEIPWKYDGKTDVDKRVIDKITEMGYSANVSYQMRNALTVTLDIEKNDAFASNFVNTVKEICAACPDFEGGAYQMVYFKIKDETVRNYSDRARIVMSKYNYSRLGVEFTPIFSGPTYEKYAEEIENLCNNDDFFKDRLSLFN